MFISFKSKRDNALDRLEEQLIQLGRREQGARNLLESLERKEIKGELTVNQIARLKQELTDLKIESDQVLDQIQQVESQK